MEERVSASGRPAAAKVWGYSYIAFFTWNLLTTWWVYNSTPEGGVLAIVCHSLFMSWGYCLAYVTRRRLGNAWGNGAFIVYWIAFEYLHMNWKLSWPWLTLGNGFSAYPEWVQWYEFTGALGGSLWVLAGNLLLYKAMKSFSVSRLIAPAAYILVPVIVSYGIYYGYEEKPDPVQVTVIQPNIDPYNEKFTNGTQDAQFEKLLRLARSQASPSTDYIVFPETSLPDALWDFQKDSLPQFAVMRAFLAAAVPRAKMVIGVSYLEMFDGASAENLPFSASRLGDSGKFYDDYNAAVQIDTSEHIPVYKKSKLVPGPESYPLPEFTRPFQDLLFGEIGGTIGNLGSQEERTAFAAPDRPGLAVGPIICYESIYGEFVTEYVQKGATLLFIITNDGWWGDTPGHRQHFQYGRLRAVETRRSIARSANTGISGFINQRGDIVQKAPYWEEAALTQTLNANSRITFYVRYGDYLGRVSVLLGAALLLCTALARFMKKRKA